LAPVPATTRQWQAGRPSSKIEQVWPLNRHYYELYLNDQGRAGWRNVVP
jgi:uncharacterized protein